MPEINIGIVGRMDAGFGFGVGDAYFRFFNMWGLPVVISPHLEEDIDRLLDFIDVFVLPGGEDVNPTRYTKKTDILTGRVNAQLEHFDEVVLPRLVSEKKKVIGICRGLQSLNVHFGGTLHQHLYGHPRSITNRWDLAHLVHTPDNVSFRVNSLHHQGIRKLGEGLIPLAWTLPYKGEDLIEAVGNEDGNIFAVQWHPEEIWDEWTIDRMERLITQK